MGASPTLELAEIADSTGPVPERAREMLETLRRLAPFDDAWLALTDPMSSSYPTVASNDLDESILQYLNGPTVTHDIERAQTVRGRAPLSPSDLPYPAVEVQTWESASSPPASARPWASPCSPAGSATSDTWCCSTGARSHRPRSCGAGCTSSVPSWRAAPIRCARWPRQRGWCGGPPPARCCAATESPDHCPASTATLCSPRDHLSSPSPARASTTARSTCPSCGRAGAATPRTGTSG